MRKPLLLTVLATCAALAACRSVPPCEPDLASRSLCEAVAGADVVFFGEAHDDRRHHEFELTLLQAMTGRGEGPLLLGMEMFQKPYQQPLDDYVAGVIDEQEMLRRTEYFDRWKFDYTFYAPLWRHCREHGLRVVALNIEASVNRKVGREGLAALTPEERAQVAADVDLTNERHKNRIMGVFMGGAHQMPQDRLEKMYEAMTAWDETMAESAANALAAAGPGARMLIVAGGQHVTDRTGIPDRLARRMPGLRGVVIDGDTVPTSDGREPIVELTAGFAKREEPPAPKLGVMFDVKPREGGGLLFQNVVEGGAAADAGIQAGDVLLSFAGIAIRDMADLRYVMDAARVGEFVQALILRGDSQMPVGVTLKPAPAPPEQPKP